LKHGEKFPEVERLLKNLLIQH